MLQAKKITQLLEEKIKYQPQETIAILVRSRSHLKEIFQRLKRLICLF